MGRRGAQPDLLLTSSDMKLSKYNLEIPEFPEKGKTVVYNTLLQGTAALNNADLKNLKVGAGTGLTVEEIQSLQELGLLLTDETDEDRIFDLFFNQMRFANSILDITLLTTMNCNFACSYCYEGELTAGKKQMSPETADNTIAWIKARALENHVSRIEIQYHGGEPLMNIPVIEKVGRELSTFCEKKSIKLRCHMVSNGYLLNRETAERIKAAGVSSVKVTIDGPEDVHNSLRSLKGGGGTYTQIINNLIEIKDILDISVGGNYSPDTAKKIPELLDDLAKAGLGPGAIKRMGFHPIVPSDLNVKATAFDTGCIPGNGLHDDFLKIEEEVVKRGFGEHAEPAMNPCSVVIPTHFTVSYDGSVYKCPAVVDRPEFAVGDVGADLSYNQEMVRSLGYNTFDNKKCRDCNVLPLCLGGCRFIALARKGVFHDIDCQKETIEAIAAASVRRMATEG